ncbi:hypothetical protein F5B21DRAFT_463935 [Xylaria acuta]|nr:hypothetical protein F5B21DRAFT_463935 [Xylaria acuta]
MPFTSINAIPAHSATQGRAAEPESVTRSERGEINERSSDYKDSTVSTTPMLDESALEKSSTLKPEKSLTEPNTRTQKLRAKRKAANLCMHCGIYPPGPNRMSCLTCLEEKRKYYQKHRSKVISRDLCRVCGKVARESDFATCAECRGKKNASMRKYWRKVKILQVAREQTGPESTSSNSDEHTKVLSQLTITGDQSEAAPKQRSASLPQQVIGAERVVTTIKTPSRRVAINDLLN